MWIMKDTNMRKPTDEEKEKELMMLRRRFVDDIDRTAKGTTDEEILAVFGGIFDVVKTWR